MTFCISWGFSEICWSRACISGLLNTPSTGGRQETGGPDGNQMPLFHSLTSDVEHLLSADRPRNTAPSSGAWAPAPAWLQPGPSPHCSTTDKQVGNWVSFATPTPAPPFPVTGKGLTEVT